MTSFAAVVLLATFAEALTAARANPKLRFYCDEGRTDPRNVVCRAIRNGAAADVATAEIARELAISEDSASAIGAAVTPMLANIGKPLPAHEFEESHAALAATLKREKNQLPIVATMAHLAAASEPAAEKFRALLPLVRAQPDPTKAAIEVTSATRHHLAGSVFLTDAFVHDPDNAELIDAIGAYGNETFIGAAFGPIVLTGNGAEMRKRQTPISAETLHERAERQLSTLALLGFADLVIAGFQVLPAEVQERIANPAAVTYQDLRLDIAAAALALGKPEIARRMSGAIASQPYHGRDHHSGARLLLAAALSNEKDELFDVIIGMFTNGISGRTAGVSAQLYAAMLEQHGYPTLAAQVTRDALHRFSYKPDIPPELAPYAQPLIARFEAMAAARRGDSPNKLLAALRIIPFTERPLPKFSGAPRKTVPVERPLYMDPVRIERIGNEVVAITTASTVDPANETGGYWIHRSRDGGTTWAAHYTGLRRSLPYVIASTSQLPLFDSARLRIEATREDKSVYLDIPWSELTRDSDNDGLTDLLEERLVTDPRDADTDDDGMRDAEDTLPQVTFRAGLGVENEILATVFEKFAPRSTFFVGDHSTFAPLTMPKRSIVLTRDEYYAYNKKFGKIDPMFIPHLVLDHAGKRAIVEVAQNMHGETYLVTKTEDGWQLKWIAGWVE
jgi:hypothetical protein